MSGARPEMAYPSFASATVTFSPSAWPETEDSGLLFRRFEADAVTAGGALHRHVSPLKERLIAIRYALLTEADKNTFAAPDGEGFFNEAGGGVFEYRHTDGNVYKVRFVTNAVESSMDDRGWWRLGPVIMRIEE